MAEDNKITCRLVIQQCTSAELQTNVPDKLQDQNPDAEPPQYVKVILKKVVFFFYFKDPLEALQESSWFYLKGLQHLVDVNLVEIFEI